MTDPRSMPTVMIVEDEALVALTLEDVLSGAGYQVCCVADRPGPALDYARAHPVEIAVVDVRLADGGNGIELATELAALGPTLILFATGNPAEVRAQATVGHGCLAKPFDNDWLLAALALLRSGSAREPHRADGASIPSFFKLPVT